MDEFVILVDNTDKEWGKMEKIKAHELGLLHRAFSIFIFNTSGKLLLQQRAFHKYHSGGLWTNSCCGHPRLGETVSDAAHRRLEEELGMQCNLTNGFHFIYKANMENQLTEHEFDHVFFGVSDEIPNPNENEVAAWKYNSLEEIEKEIRLDKSVYTEWFKICFSKVKAYY
ncbi:MAG TPA: isopentenyl-diphosphate Delta-isomerase, partial [Bacteroidia bacterium]|nr:isopentenyl-diphosphate Delta-isomerase [Bacteroidia bacterium]